MFEWANSAFATLVATLVYSTYSTTTARPAPLARSLQAQAATATCPGNACGGKAFPRTGKPLNRTSAFQLEDALAPATFDSPRSCRAQARRGEVEVP